MEADLKVFGTQTQHYLTQLYSTLSLETAGHLWRFRGGEWHQQIYVLKRPDWRGIKEARMIHLFFSSFFFFKFSKYLTSSYYMFLGGSDGKESSCNAGDLGSIFGSGRSPGEGNGNPLQYSCLGNPMDRRTWRATGHGVARGRQDLAMKPLIYFP